MSDMITAFCDGIRPDPIPVRRLARAYGCSKQNIYQIVKRGIPIGTFVSPSLLLDALLAIGNRSPLRRRLSDPSTRQSIIEVLYE